LSITNSLLWPRLISYIKIEVYDRDGGAPHARRRIEFRNIPDKDLMQAALLIEVACPCCGELNNPIRRRSDRSVYFAAACPLEKNYRCSRSRRCSAEYAVVVAAVEKENVDRSVERTHAGI
jgi:hypothetical protein